MVIRTIFPSFFPFPSSITHFLFPLPIYQVWEGEKSSPPPPKTYSSGGCPIKKYYLYNTKRLISKCFTSGKFNTFDFLLVTHFFLQIYYFVRKNHGTYIRWLLRICCAGVLKTFFLK